MARRTAVEMIHRKKGSYKTTLAVFFFLLSIIVIVFAVTSVVKAPKVNGALSYEQLIQKVRTSPNEIEEISMIRHEPFIVIRFKGDPTPRHLVLSMESKADLYLAAQKSQIPLKEVSLDRSKSRVQVQGLQLEYPFLKK